MPLRSEPSGLLHQIRKFERAARPLDPGTTRRKQLRKKVVASSERFLRRIDTARAYVDTDGKGIGLLERPIVEEGMAIDAALELLEREVVTPGAQTASGGHLAYIPAGGIYHSALADFLAAVHNKYAGIFFTGPGPVRMENLVVRWVADLVGYPAAAGGHIASGGSLATLAAIVAAREAHRVKGADFASSAVYLTTQSHHAIDKALRIAGMAEAPVRRLPTDASFRMRPEVLAAAIAEDRRRGLRPWLIAATAGTTDTGAVDPLDPIADVAAREGCWLHVDAAYGGFFLLTAHGREAMRGIERSDSAVLDPHKSLFLPWGCGVVVTRDVATLVAAHGTGVGSYMQDALRAPNEISPADTSAELTKPFRALRMWLPLMLIGTKPFRAALEEKLLLARYFHQRVAALGFEVGPSPDLSVVVYRWAPAGLDLEATNAINQAIVDRLRADGRVFLSSTMLDGVFFLRLAALSFRTHLRAVDLALRLLAEQAAIAGS